METLQCNNRYNGVQKVLCKFHAMVVATLNVNDFRMRLCCKKSSFLKKRFYPNIVVCIYGTTQVLPRPRFCLGVPGPSPKSHVSLVWYAFVDFTIRSCYHGNCTMTIRSLANCKIGNRYLANYTIGSSYFANCTIESCYLANCTIGSSYLASCTI